MIELWHCHNTRSLRVLWALEEMKLKYRLHSLPFPPRILERSYLETNPLGTVPFLKDDETTLTESSAMLLYLAERYQKINLTVATTHKDYGAYLNWLFSSDATLTFPQTLILRYGQFEKLERRQPQVVKDYAIWYLARLKRLNIHLEHHTYLVANKFTMADISIGYALYLGELLGLAKSYQPQTYAYLQKLKNRESFIAIKNIGQEISNYTIKSIEL
ncbi:glutathione S-transferase family protein [Cognaticolwellia mytili]|uniref:glutathione S-transferase family protein n=1 Tax=Cognaticolwellia mytili TaxID=1888913 RepID=UPI001F201B01|nr:glutathione S-transferase family protein [Cognaticolwellia mytili]